MAVVVGDAASVAAAAVVEAEAVREIVDVAAG